MPPAKKNADSVKKRAPSRPRAKKKIDEAEEPAADYNMSVQSDEKLSVHVPEHHRPSFNADAAFLAPEAMSFDLKLSKRAQVAQEKPLKKSRGFGRLFLYLVTFIVLIAAITAIVLAFQASQQLADNSGSTSSASLSPIPTSAAGATPAVGTAYQLGMFNVPQPVNAAVSSLLAKDTPNITIDTSPSSFIPAGAGSSLSADTLFIKTSAQPQGSVILAELAKLGLQPTLSVNDGISDDFSLYLVSPPVSTNLSAYTATVINASGVIGAAKKYCGYLTTYKVSSCTPQNGTAQKPGALQVYYTDPKAMVQLSRTTQFQSASFMQVSPASQTGSIQVVLGIEFR